MVHAFNPSTEEAEAGRTLVSSRPAWSNKSSRTAWATQRNPVSQKPKKSPNLKLEQNGGKNLGLGDITQWWNTDLG